MKSFFFSLSIFLHANHHMHIFLALSIIWFGSNKTMALALGNQTDHLALLKFKESISNDPNGALDSWNSSIHFCNWHGITCSLKHQRVTEMNISGHDLHGSLSPYVGNLSFLRSLNLGNNCFFEKIPHELGRLFRLQQLSLPNNSFIGEIPTNLTNLHNLKGLDLGGNHLIGKIPIEIGFLWKLQTLKIVENNLTGEVPPFLGNLSSLTTFYVGFNNLEGVIPQEVCRLKHLTKLSVVDNNLSGTLSSCVYNMSFLTIISASLNNFNGSLCSNLFHTLPSLQRFAISTNQISGLIPTSVANASTLTHFDISQNHFFGQVPSLGKLQNLYWLDLYLNNLGDNSTKDLEFLKPLTNFSKLSTLGISFNNFGGSLPSYIGNLTTQLSRLYLGGNQIFGQIPLEIGNLINLILLTMESSHFEGKIPSTIGKFQKIQVLDLRGNRLSGEIPASIGNLSQMYHLGLGKNMLEGNIPSNIGKCKSLQMLYLSENNLTGVIPSEVFSLSSLTVGLFLSQNLLCGKLPDEVGHLQNIEQIDVSENHLTGEIPGTLGECISLEYILLMGNSFNGSIPSSFASLKGLRYLDLSRNRLSGSIPKFLQNISFLEYFNVSFNMLEGEVPSEGVFRNSSALGVTQNKNLCGGILELHLPPCHTKHNNFKEIVVIVSGISFLLIMIFIITIYWMRRIDKTKKFDSQINDQMVPISYKKLHNATNGFSTSNLIGLGNFGSVYKGKLESVDGFVAIKVLNLNKTGAQKSFIAECTALKNIRHRNLVKILTCCSSIDYKGNEFKALIFEYMSNGNLESWLHPTTEIPDQPKSLTLEQRLNIIIDVASAFCYLHYECEQPVVHCDLKPANVLLNDSLLARVSDFGLARLLPSVGISLMQSSTIGIKGTVGYAPLEYGMGSEVSIEGDMYSFGILILEMLTGRRPTDEMFKDDHNLHNYVKHSIPNHLFHIVDQSILDLPIELDHNTDNGNLGGIIHPNLEKCLLAIFSIALSCSVESPKERMNMVDVIRELNIIKSFFPTEAQ
ncbi:putative receptor-like protein kinase At3g47110 [Trifolium pratense]|nr:putative receptor-like protein kinase At3g47110 [Trifolium pratense]XP_045813758.1 putative receptor-like protein kinase At3g47110 [Trifolium pratense]